MVDMANGKGQGNKGKQNDIFSSFYRAIKGFSNALPMLLGVVLLLGIFKAFVTKQMMSSVFSGKLITDTFVGSLIGSISAGNPITSYIIGGELLSEGVSLFAVTAFIVAWVTVGIAQFPAEAAILGRRFSVARNIISFILSIIVAISTVLILGVLT